MNPTILEMLESREMMLALGKILFALVLVGLNGFFVAAEFAIVKVRRTRLEELAGMGIASARLSLLCLRDLDEYLSATQLGITFASLALGWVGEDALVSIARIFWPEWFANQHSWFHGITLVVCFLLVTLLHVVFGELIPKSMAIQKAEKITLLVTRPLLWFYRISKPLIMSFTWLANFFLKRMGYLNLEEPPLTENELKLVMKESKEDGVISDSEAQIITRAFEFADKRASDIMVSREKVDFVSMAQPLEANLSAVRRNSHTRFPVCSGDFDKVIGIVHMKDVWPQLLARFSNEVFQECRRPPLFVQPTLRQDQILKLFQSCRAHMAVVQDPASGKNLGIVTMEDVLESLVGEIRDEHGN